MEVDVDDMGTIHVKWEDGRRMGIICDEDSIKKI